MKMGTQQPADPGDDSGILRAHVHYAHDVGSVLLPNQGSAVGTVVRHPDGRWELVFSLDRGGGRRQRHFVSVDPEGVRTDRWRLVRLGPGVWDLDPSLHVPGQIHVFLTLIAVPEPAPWSTER